MTGNNGKTVGKTAPNTPKTPPEAPPEDPEIAYKPISYFSVSRAIRSSERYIHPDPNNESSLSTFFKGSSQARILYSILRVIAKALFPNISRKGLQTFVTDFSSAHVPTAKYF